MKNSAILWLALGAIIGFLGGYVWAGFADDGDAILNSTEAPVATGKRESDNTAARRRLDEGEGRAIHRKLRPYDGQGTIVVNIHTTDGEPLDNARVTLTPKAPEEPDEDAENRSIQDLADAYRSRLEWVEAATREMHSGDEGVYSFEDLADTEWTAAAEATGYLLKAEGATRRLRSGRVVEFTAQACGQFQVNVVLSDGRAAESAVLRAVVGGRKSAWNWRPDADTFNVPYGSFEVRAEFARDDFDVLRSEPTTISVSEDRPLAAARFVLNAVDSIEVRVRDEYGQPADEVYVYVHHLADGAAAPSSEKLVSERRNGTRLNEVEAGRHLGLIDRPGRYAIIVVRDLRGAAPVEVVSTRGGRTSIAIAVRPPLREDRLEVTIASPPDAPLGKLDFKITRSVDHKRRTHSPRAEPRGDGVFWLPLPLAADDDGAATWTLVTECALGAKAVEFARTSASRVDVEFPAPGELLVVVDGAGGSPHAGLVSLSVKPTDSSQPVAIRARRRGLDIDGSQGFGPLTPGEYQVDLSIGASRSSAKRVVDSRRVLVMSGTNEIHFLMPPMQSLRVLVPAGTIGERVVLREHVDERRSARAAELRSKLNDAYAADFEVVPPGDWDLIVNGLRGVRSVTIPGPSVVTFVGDRTNAFVISQVLQRSYVATVGLQDGDLLLGIDGLRFVDDQTNKKIMDAAIDRVDVRLIVLRDGREIAVDCNWRQLLADTPRGFRMKPMTRD